MRFNPSKTVPFGFAACICVLVVLIPALSLVTTDGPMSLSLVIATSVTAYSGFRLSCLAFYSQRSILQVTFWMFVYCWLGIAAMVQLKAGRFPWPVATDADEFLGTEAVVIVGLVAYEVGVRFGRKPRQRGSALLTLGHPSLRRFIMLTLACLAISSWAMYRKGGLSEVVRTRYELKGISRFSGLAQSDLLTYNALQRVPAAVSLLVAVYLFTEKSRQQLSRPLMALSLAGILTFNLIANYPPSLPRLYLGFILVSIAALVLRIRTKAVPLFVLSMIVGLTVLFPYADYFRSKTGYSTFDLEAPTQKLIDKPDYDVFQMIGNTIKVVNEDGAVGGSNFLGAILFFVPRAVWPEKPHGTGWIVGRQVGYTMLNLCSPLWAEFYYGGGITLLIAGFCAYGYFTRNAERQALLCSANALFVAYAAGVQIFLLRGDLLNSVAYFAPGALLLLAFVGRPGWFLSRVSRSQLESPKLSRFAPGEH